MKKIQAYPEVFFVILSFAIILFSTGFQLDDRPVMGLDKLAADLVISAVCYFLIGKLSLKHTAGFQAAGFWKGVLLGVPFLIIGIGSVIYSNLFTDLRQLHHISLWNTVLFCLNMLLVGVNEELWMRGLILNCLIHKYRSEGLWKPVVISSLIFGLVHLVNGFFVPAMLLAVQVINAMCGGVLFAAVFIRSKNIYSVILVHALTDWIALFLSNCFVGGASALGMQIGLPQALFMIAGGSLPPVLIACFLLRGKYGEAEAFLSTK